ncbi:hypothetical protein B566_EDAN008222 [Ephemera danica]|nr:hypothetical protein B566_EDAN008222 [Ephemera danica]
MQGVQSTSEASTSARPAAAAAASVAPSGREEAAVEPSTSQQENSAEEQAPVSAGATVVLVRPQEVQPAVSSSQSLQSVTAPPSTSRPPPTLKRSRDEVATRSEEPQVKLACMEVTSGNAEAVAVVAPSLQEEPSSSHGQTFEAMVTSNEEPEREADAQETEREPGDTTAQDEDAPMENETSEVVDSDSQNEVLIIDEERDNGNQAEPSSSSGPSPSARHSELFRAVEALLDSGTASSAQSEPTSSSNVSLPRPPTLRAPQAHLVLVRDDSIVPSTPTLFVPRRREGFGEGVSSPQVPQSQGRLFTFAPESTPSPMSAPQVSASGGSETLEEARLEASDDPGTGRNMVPSIAPSVESQPQETPEVTESVPSEVDVPSSSSSVPVIMVTPAASQEEEGFRTPPDQTMQTDEADEQETVQQTVVLALQYPVHLSEGFRVEEAQLGVLHNSEGTTDLEHPLYGMKVKRPSITEAKRPNESSTYEKRNDDPWIPWTSWLNSTPLESWISRRA